LDQKVTVLIAPEPIERGERRGQCKTSFFGGSQSKSLLDKSGGSFVETGDIGNATLERIDVEVDNIG